MFSIWSKCCTLNHFPRLLQICPNGLVCFNRPHEGYTVPNNNGYDSSYRNKYCLAPYFTDLNPSQRGAVNYNDFDLFRSSDNASKEAASIAGSLVTQYYNTSFEPLYVLQATWIDVPPFGGYNTEVGFNIFHYSKTVASGWLN